MSEKTVVVALGHRALGTTLPEQKLATRQAARAIADLVEEGARVVISHSNGPQIGMIHTAMNEFGKAHPDYTFAPMSVCSAMSQGYIGYDLQNAIRAELISRGIYKPLAFFPRDLPSVPEAPALFLMISALFLWHAYNDPCCFRSGDTVFHLFYKASRRPYIFHLLQARRTTGIFLRSSPCLLPFLIIAPVPYAGDSPCVWSLPLHLIPL